jgi:WD40 repeat protein
MRQREQPGWDEFAAVSPDGRQRIAGGYDWVQVMDVQTGRIVRRFDPLRGPAALSPDGRILAACTAGNAVELRDARTGRRLRTLGPPGDWEQRAIMFSPNGTIVAAGSDDGGVRLWSAATGRPLRTLAGGDLAAISLAFTPDGKLLASGHEDGPLRLWSVVSGRLLTTLQILPCEKSEEPCRDWIAYTPEGYYDGSPGAERFIRWRVGDRLLPAAAFAGRFHRPDRVRAATGGD